GPRLPAFQGGPHVYEGFRRHVGMTHHVVRLPEDLIPIEPADGDERRVGVADVAVRVRDGHEGRVVGVVELLSSNRLVVAHPRLPLEMRLPFERRRIVCTRGRKLPSSRYPRISAWPAEGHT